MGLFGLIGGAAAPWLGPNVPILGGLPPVGFLSWPMVVWRRVQLIWFGFGLILHMTGPDSLGKWAFPLGLLSGLCFVVFFVYFKHIFHVIPTCPSVNGKSPKLVELFSYKY